MLLMLIDEEKPKTTPKRNRDLPLTVDADIRPKICKSLHTSYSFSLNDPTDLRTKLPIDHPLIVEKWQVQSVRDAEEKSRISVWTCSRCTGIRHASVAMFVERTSPMAPWCTKVPMGELEIGLTPIHTHTLSLQHLLIGVASLSISLSLFSFYLLRYAYCFKDYQDTFGTKCNGCGQVIVGEVLTANEKTYHPNCFLCGTCKVLLSGQFYVAPNGGEICSWQLSLSIIIRCWLLVTTLSLSQVSPIVRNITMKQSAYCVRNAIVLSYQV